MEGGGKGESFLEGSVRFPPHGFKQSPSGRVARIFFFLEKRGKGTKETNGLKLTAAMEDGEKKSSEKAPPRKKKEWACAEEMPLKWKRPYSTAGKLQTSCQKEENELFLGGRPGWPVGVTENGRAAFESSLKRGGGPKERREENECLVWEPYPRSGRGTVGGERVNCVLQGKFGKERVRQSSLTSPVVELGGTGGSTKSQRTEGEKFAVAGNLSGRRLPLSREPGARGSPRGVDGGETA